jgi:putative transposase
MGLTLEREHFRLDADVLILGADDDARRACVYGELLRSALEDQPLTDLRLAPNQDQPVDNDRFYREVEVITGPGRELRKRARPRKRADQLPGDVSRQGTLRLGPINRARPLLSPFLSIEPLF